VGTRIAVRAMHLGNGLQRMDKGSQVDLEKGATRRSRVCIYSFPYTENEEMRHTLPKRPRSVLYKRQAHPRHQAPWDGRNYGRH
jgi:hypothetical protein